MVGQPSIEESGPFMHVRPIETIDNFVPMNLKVPTKSSLTWWRPAHHLIRVCSHVTSVPGDPWRTLQDERSPPTFARVFAAVQRLPEFRFRINIVLFGLSYQTAPLSRYIYYSGALCSITRHDGARSHDGVCGQFGVDAQRWPTADPFRGDNGCRLNRVLRTRWNENEGLVLSQTRHFHALPYTIAVAPTRRTLTVPEILRSASTWLGILWTIELTIPCVYS